VGSLLPFFKAMLGGLFCIMSLSAARAAVAERVCRVLLLFGGVWAEVPDAPFNGGFDMTLFPVLFCSFLCALLLLMEMYEGLLYDYSLYLATAFSGEGFWPFEVAVTEKGSPGAWLGGAISAEDCDKEVRPQHVTYLASFFEPLAEYVRYT
jgi:hypothetical protein